MKMWFPNTEEMTAHMRRFFTERRPHVTFFSAGNGRKGAQINSRHPISNTHMGGEDGRLMTAGEIDARISSAQDIVYCPSFDEEMRMKG